MCTVDPIEGCGAHQPKELDGKQLRSTTTKRHEQVDEDGKNKLEELRAELQLLAKFTKEVSSDEVDEVDVSSGLVVSPCALTTSEHG